MMQTVWGFCCCYWCRTHTFWYFQFVFFFLKLLKVQAVMLKRMLPLELDDQLQTITVQEMLSPMPVLFRNWIWTRHYTSEGKRSSAEAALSLCAYVFFGAQILHELFALLSCLEFILQSVWRLANVMVGAMLATFHSGLGELPFVRSWKWQHFVCLLSDRCCDILWRVLSGYWSRLIWLQKES